MYEASSEARNATSAATSSGRPSRRSGTWLSSPVERRDLGAFPRKQLCGGSANPRGAARHERATAREALHARSGTPAPTCAATSACVANQTFARLPASSIRRRSTWMR
ncbi:MAG: hypothetical protein QOE36_3235 [Gaiellaceae bacterium]|nr:hypothetical protein [Gaiellaceae bacterium]